jgi:lysosomal acid lipase/cholesteryl ester hydrolase
MWQSVLYPPIFVRAIDMGLSFLFGWHARNISASQKLAAYPHLYSFTSTKSVVHWFQIIRTKSFQMYDDDVQTPLSMGSVSKYTKVAKFPTRNIKTPIVLVYGGSDSLVDINVMLKELPSHTIATEIPHYEHLDFLWAREVDTLVFPHVYDALESFCDAEHSKEEYERYRSARHASLGAGMKRPLLLPSYMSEDDTTQTYAGIAGHLPGADQDAIVQPTNGHNRDVSFPGINARKRALMHTDYDDSSEGSSSPVKHVRTVIGDVAVANGDGSQDTSPTGKLRDKRSSSVGSNLSFTGGGRGFVVGASKAVSGVSKGETVGKVTTGSDFSDSVTGGGVNGKRKGRKS